MKSKLPTLLLSFIVAMGLWLYVVTTVSPEADQNYTGIPVVFENETSLLDRGLMLVSGENATVSVRLYGKRANLNWLTSSNIIVTADLKAVTEPGKYELEYKVSYPSGITNVSLDKRITPSVTVEAVEFAEERTSKTATVFLSAEIASGPLTFAPKVYALYAVSKSVIASDSSAGTASSSETSS